MKHRAVAVCSHLALLAACSKSEAPKPSAGPAVASTPAATAPGGPASAVTAPTPNTGSAGPTTPATAVGTGDDQPTPYRPTPSPGLVACPENSPCIEVEVGGAPKWLLFNDEEGSDEGGHSETVSFSAVIKPDAKAFKTAKWQPAQGLSGSGYIEDIQHFAVDLDGDRTSEIIEEISDREGRTYWAVNRLSANGRLVEFISGQEGWLLISADGTRVEPAEPGCTTTHSIDAVTGGTGREIRITYGKGCEETGTHRWTVAKGKLVELK